MSSREDHEASEANYLDGVLPPNQGDRMISQAEEGQVIKPLPKKHRVTDKELVEDFLNPRPSRGSGSQQVRRHR